MAKCRHCGKRFRVEEGKFPKALFEHIGKKHPGVHRKGYAKKAPGVSTHSAPSGTFQGHYCPVCGVLH